MNAYPFSVFKRHDRPSYLVSFKDDHGNYLPPISTRKKNEKEAMEVAFKWLRDGVPQKKDAINKVYVKNIVSNIKTKDEAKSILNELSRLGWVKGYAVKDTEAAQDFISFLKNFWDWNTSPYIQEKLRKKHGIHKRHCKIQGQSITLYWQPFFNGRVLGEITAKEIDAFINHMATKEVSASRKNVVIKAGFKPLRWAFAKNMIEIDPTRGHILFSDDSKKREILTPVTVAALFKIEWTNKKAKLANMLASITGMRSGEILALRYKDLGPDCLYVNSSWNDEDKLKTTKTNEARTVEIPFPDIMKALFEQAMKNPYGVSPESFVFWADKNSHKPMLPQSLLDALRKNLILIGLSEKEAAKFMFHGWRHFFTSYMVGHLDKKLLKGETGHKTDIMINRYSDHKIAGDRELIQSKKREIFAEILPQTQKVLLLEYKPLPITTAA